MTSGTGSTLGRSEFKFVAKKEHRSVSLVPAVYEDSVPAPAIPAIDRFLDADHEQFSGYLRDGNNRLAIRLSRMDRAPGSNKCSVEIRTGTGFYGLTVREHEIATDVALGLTNLKIAEIRSCSPRTVEAHVNSICRKLEVENRIGVATLIAGVSGWLLPLSETSAVSLHLQQVLPLDDRHLHGIALDGVPDAFAKEHVLIGALYPTGSERINDRKAMELGAELAVQEINEQHSLLGGRPLAIIHPSGIAKSPLDALQELIDAGADGLIIGNQPLGVAKSVLSVAARSGIPTMHSMVDGSLSSFVEDDFQATNIFQMCADESVYLKAFQAFLNSRFAAERYEFSARRIAVIQRAAGDLPTQFSDTLRELKAQGWQVASTITYEEGTVSWPEVALQLYQAGVEAVYVGAYLEDGLRALLDCLDRFPARPLLFCTWIPGIPGFHDRAGEQAEGLVWCTIAGNTNDFFGRTFDLRFMQRYHSSPGIGSAAVHFDMVNFMTKAWNTVGDTIDREEVEQEMSSMVYRGAAGSYYFDHGLRRALCYPFDTDDQSVGQVCLTYHIEQGTNVLIPFDQLQRAGE